MKALLVDRGVPPGSISVIPNAVDTDTFVPVERDDRLARAFGIGDDDVVLGCVSTFSSYEGISFLVDALARLRQRGHPVRGLLIGDGDEGERLRAQVSGCGIADHVIFAGRVPHADVPRYYGLIDIVVVPRTNDRVAQLVTPLKPFEAMSAGRALIVSGVPPLREIIDPAVTGLVFRPEDAEDLADVAEPLVVDRGKRTALGRAARAWVCRHRAWTQVGRRYRELYEAMGVASPERPTVAEGVIH